MYRLTSANHLRTLFAAATATYSSHRCLADPPPSPVTDDFVNVAEKRQIRGENAEALPENAHQSKVPPPKLLAKNVAMLTCDSSADGGICNVFLIRTRHCSRESRREVRAVIQLLKPEPKGMKAVTNGESRSELTEAFNQAMQHGAKVILGDRPIEITSKRIAANLSNWDFIKLAYYDQFDKDGLPAKVLERLLSVPAQKNPLTTPLLVLNSVAAAALAGIVIVLRIVSKK